MSTAIKMEHSVPYLTAGSTALKIPTLGTIPVPMYIFRFGPAAAGCLARFDPPGSGPGTPFPGSVPGQVLLGAGPVLLFRLGQCMAYAWKLGS